jgi:hypothetical protein
VTESKWDQLPAQLRERIDELVLADERFRAVRELWESGGEKRISLNRCQDVVHERYLHFGDRVRFKQPPPRDVATLTAAVEAIEVRPSAIEALWDGDTTGWMVFLYAVTREPRSEKSLAMIRHGSDLRLFNGTVPPWPEAQEAVETGTALARHFDIPFFFLNPDNPDLPDVRWWDTV